MIFIIEHMEPELYEWCLLEYRHMSSIVGKENIWFTNVKDEMDRKKLSVLGTAKKESATSLGLRNVCVLDLPGEGVLLPSDKNEFDYVVFGGILGDNPPKGRTKPLRDALIAQGAAMRNLGEVQMSTDTAVLVTKMILDGTPFEKIDFIDNLVIETAPNEEVELPYRYVSRKGKPVLPPGLIEKLSKDEF